MTWNVRITRFFTAGLALLALAGPGAVLAAEVVVLGAGSSTGPASADDASSGADGPLLSARELETLVGPIALYPDDLLAVVLPAAAYPLQIVQAARYLDALQDDPELEPDPGWDESVIALLNYPDALARLNDDLDWTAALGDAVLAQEQALLEAVDAFRRKAYAAGNLASDHRQRVDVDEQHVSIRPADPAVLFVPYYQPALVHRPHLRNVYHYHSRPCPVYYYPYPAGHYLASDRFWGMTGAFGIAWHDRHLSFHLLDHRSHPYYGHDYALRHYRYWRPRLLDDRRERGHDRFRVGKRRYFEDRVSVGGRRDLGGRLRFEERIGLTDGVGVERHRGDDRRWRSSRDRGSVDRSVRERRRADVPFTRPPAGTGLSRLHRHRTEPGAAPPRSLERRMVRDPRSNRAVAPRAGTREARPERRSRTITAPRTRESRAQQPRAIQRPAERAGDGRFRRAEGPSRGHGAGARVRPR